MYAILHNLKIFIMPFSRGRRSLRRRGRSRRPLSRVRGVRFSVRGRRGSARRRNSKFARMSVSRGGIRL